MLVDAVGHLPRDGQMVRTLAGRPDDDVALVHVRHALLRLHERDVVEGRMDNDALDVGLPLLVLPQFLFGLHVRVVRLLVVVRIFWWPEQ